MIRKLAIALALLTAAGVATGAAAVVPIGESAPLQVVELDGTVPTVVPTTTQPPADDPGDDDGDEHDGDDKKVWVCVVLVRKDGIHLLKPGKNPVHVSVNSHDARDAASADHPSYVVDDGAVQCRVDGKHVRGG
jgi:hypothetical protein